MRKFFFILCLCATMQLQAQKLSFGIESGVSIGNQRDFFVANYNGYPTQKVITFSDKNSVTPMVGFFLQNHLSEVFAVRSGLQYMENENFTHQAHFKYWTIPVSICYNTSPGFSLNAGGYVSFLSNSDDVIPFFANVRTLFSKNDSGVNFGCEKVVYRNFSLCVTYFIGLKNLWLFDHNVISNPNVNGTSDEKITNRILQFSVRYKLGKGM